MKEGLKMKVGDRVNTPRFCTVQIKEIFDDVFAAREHGYTEPTYFTDKDYVVVGKSLDMYHMEFAAYRK